MSLSKIVPNCMFCKIGRGIYSCPKCSRKYCSSHCYKSRQHVECSEAFYKEWIEQSLQEKSCDSLDKENMLRTLKKFEEGSDQNPVEDELSMEDRFAGLNINEADEDVIWQHLSEEEKKIFKALIHDENNLETIVSVKQPWWTLTTLNLVTELDSDDPDLKDGIALRPPYPINSQKLSELTSTKPSSCIQYNLVTILYTYAFLCRFYNCDLRDFLEDVVDSIFTLTPVLSDGRNYSTLEEALQDSIRVISNSDFNIPMTFVKSIFNDVGNIMHGPSNGRCSTFVLCALHDIKLLFLELKYVFQEKENPDKSLKKRLLLAVKKVEYFISWCLEFESTLSDIASDLVLLMLPALIPSSNNPGEHDTASKFKEKPLIEEVD